MYLTNVLTSVSAMSGWLSRPLPMPNILYLKSDCHQDCSQGHIHSVRWQRTQQCCVCNNIYLNTTKNNVIGSSSLCKIHVYTLSTLWLLGPIRTPWQLVGTCTCSYRVSQLFISQQWLQHTRSFNKFLLYHMHLKELPIFCWDSHTSIIHECIS